MSELLTTYLQDHHAGSEAGTDLFERVADQHSDPAVAEAVRRLGVQVGEDQQALEGIMERCGAKTSTLKDLGGKIAEKAARLKPNERLASRSPLSDVIELETLIMGVHGKLLLWEALVQLADPRLDQAELTRLRDRAEAQQRELRELRLTQVAKMHQH